MDTNIIDRLKDEVDIFDLFDAATPPVKYHTRKAKHNISCPFHGVDNKPSFTIYPDTNSAFCYTCNGGQAWDVISLWAQLNEWWNDDGTLDNGKAISDLCRRYNIRATRPDWRKGLEKNLKGASARRQGYSGIAMEQRLDLKENYIYKVARRVLKLEDRRSRWSDVVTIWDSLDDINLDSDEWLVDLKAWYKDSLDLLAPPVDTELEVR